MSLSQGKSTTRFGVSRFFKGKVTIAIGRETKTHILPTKINKKIAKVNTFINNYSCRTISPFNTQHTTHTQQTSKNKQLRTLSHTKTNHNNTQKKRLAKNGLAKIGWPNTMAKNGLAKIGLAKVGLNCRSRDCLLLSDDTDGHGGRMVRRVGGKFAACMRIYSKAVMCDGRGRPPQDLRQMVQINMECASWVCEDFLWEHEWVNPMFSGRRLIFWKRWICDLDVSLRRQGSTKNSHIVGQKSQYRETVTPRTCFLQ